MKNKYINDSMAADLAAGMNYNTGPKNYLVTKPTNIYEVRLIPNIKDSKKSIFKYIQYTWPSLATGERQTVVSPRIPWGEKDYIGSDSYQIYQNRNENPELYKKSRKVIRQEKYITNVYVVRDPTNPDNEGKLKMFRFGNQVFKVIERALKGDPELLEKGIEDEDQIGMPIFDLTPDGYTLRIHVTENDLGLPNYEKSTFLKQPSEAKGMTEDLMEQCYTNPFDLWDPEVTGVQQPDPEENKKIWRQHFYCEDIEVTATNKAADSGGAELIDDDDDDEEIEEAPKKPAKKPIKKSLSSGAKKQISPLDDDDDVPMGDLDDVDVDDLLDGIDD